MRRTVLVPLLAAGLVLGATQAAAAAPAPAADTASASASARVRVADLDLRSQAGAEAALQRIERAATTVCGGEPDIRDLERQPVFKACVRAAVLDTVAHSRSPALAALTGTPLADAMSTDGELAAAN